MGEININELCKVIESKYIFTDVLMKKHTTFKIGGIADVMVLPETEEQISSVIIFCSNNDIPWFIIGKGSNLLVSDKGIRGVVIKFGDNFSGIEQHEQLLNVKAGTSLSRTALHALKRELSGLEFASGIPGTVGGGILMNAGAYDGEIAQVILTTRYMDTNGKIHELKAAEHNFSYRHSVYQQNGGIILSGVFLLKNGIYSDIIGKMTDFNNCRRDKQPLDLPSAGSSFKHPSGYYAAKLINECGLKGYTVGGAQVSEKHCGFIVNKDNATCSDILNVIEHIKSTVYEKTGIVIETEIKVIGEF